MIVLKDEDQDLFFFYMGMTLASVTDPEFRKSILKYVNRVGSQTDQFVPYEVRE